MGFSLKMGVCEGSRRRRPVSMSEPQRDELRNRRINRYLYGV